MFLTPPQNHTHKSGISAFNLRAVPLFENMRWRGRLYRLCARLTFSSWRLRSLDEDAPIHVFRRPELPKPQPVELSRIIGSLGRCADFDRRFYPLRDASRSRWVRVVSMMMQDRPLPPVELIRVGVNYFVVDGHHRISAAKALRCATIDAVITAVYD